MTKSRAARAPRPAQPHDPGPTHVTITFTLAGHSVEAATTLVTRWLSGEIGQPVRPLTITSVRIGNHPRIPDPARDIAAHRRRLHLTQEQLAARAGVSRVAVNMIERGTLGITSPSAVAVRRALADAETAR